MTLTLSPTKLSGSVTPPPSKSLAHRMILAAALAEGESVLENITMSEDIRATLHCLPLLGATWHLTEQTLHIVGNGGRPLSPTTLPRFDCGESGSTLRFLIPIALAVTGGGTFVGRGRLMTRPLAPYFDLFREKGIVFSQTEHTLIIRGTLPSGEYRLAGNVSSQFFTGLLLALPLCRAPSRILSTTQLESADYVTMTCEVLRCFGISVTSFPPFTVPGNCEYRPRCITVDTDWSQAAFWYAANALGSTITVSHGKESFRQGDCIFPEWIAQLRSGGTVTIDAAQHPDLVPPLAACACAMKGTLHITHIARLRLKESDRVAAIVDTLTALGAALSVCADTLCITGKPHLRGGTVDAHGDHRIAMMLAIAALHCTSPVTLTGAECVAKSYPTFWEDYQALGGIVYEHTGE